MSELQDDKKKVSKTKLFNSKRDTNVNSSDEGFSEDISDFVKLE
jgi:hypothetical protein